MSTIASDYKKFKRRHIVTTVSPLLKTTQPCIVEAGAFDGTDTAVMAQQWAQGVIHAFEPLPDAYALLVQRISACPNVITYPLALSSATGEAVFYVSEKPSQPEQPFKAGSLCKPTGRLARSPVKYPRTITVPTITLDDWSSQEDITKIDMLWLDVQGHALSILQASPWMLKRIHLLYVELEFTAAYQGQPSFDDAYEWLTAHGFQEVGRDFIDQSSWFYGNILFKRRAP